jgi:hypothetical protein
MRIPTFRINILSPSSGLCICMKINIQSLSGTFCSTLKAVKKTATSMGKDVVVTCVCVLGQVGSSNFVFKLKLGASLKVPYRYVISNAHLRTERALDTSSESK